MTARDQIIRQIRPMIMEVLGVGQDAATSYLAGLSEDERATLRKLWAMRNMCRAGRASQEKRRNG